MPQYRWTGDGNFRDHHNGDRVAPGELVTLPAHAGDPQPALERVVAAPFDPGELTVTELRDRLADADYDTATLDVLAEAEADGQDRTTALEAIDSARE